MPDSVSETNGMKKNAMATPCITVGIINVDKSAWVLKCERIHHVYGVIPLESEIESDVASDAVPLNWFDATLEQSFHPHNSWKVERVLEFKEVVTTINFDSHREISLQRALLLSIYYIIL